MKAIDINVYGFYFLFFHNYFEEILTPIIPPRIPKTIPVIIIIIDWIVKENCMLKTLENKYNNMIY